MSSAFFREVRGFAGGFAAGVFELARSGAGDLVVFGFAAGLRAVVVRGVAGVARLAAGIAHHQVARWIAVTIRRPRRLVARLQHACSGPLYLVRSKSS